MLTGYIRIRGVHFNPVAPFLKLCTFSGNYVVMELFTDSRLTTFIQQFEQCTLPAHEWTHEAHLIAGVWYAFHYHAPASLAQMKKRIISYNEAVGTINSEQSGYHETITCFWMKVIQDFLDEGKFSSVLQAVSAFLPSRLNRRDLIFFYYSREFLCSVEARMEYIPPDLQGWDMKKYQHLLPDISDHGYQSSYIGLWNNIDY